MKKTLFLATFIVAVSFNLFAQYNIQLLGKKTYSGQNLSGSWGYNDTVNHKEYGLIGTTKGLSIVDITTPANPVEVKFINGKQGTWRECQTYKQYAYITQDNDTTNSEGILIYDLSLIPNGKADTFKGTTPNDYIARSHSLFIDEKGFLYLNGGDAKVNGTRTNGVMIYDLKPNPVKPTYVGFTQNLFGTGAVNYVHDCYVRNDTMYQAHIYNNRFTVWDVRNRSNPIKIQDFATPYSTIHNMWLSDNSKTLFVSHEQFNFPAEAYDISDLNNIHQLCEFKVSPTNKEILHNVHVLNDYIIGSYYSDGVAIFDASDPSNVICVGYYDTQPNSTKTENGVWGAWGFYKSGVITLSDMLKGLFVVQPTYIRAARMQGVVTDTVTTQSLSGVKISFVDTANSVLSIIDGSYKTGTVKAGLTNFKAEKTGYITKYFSAILINGKIDTVNIQLRQTPIEVRVNATFCENQSYTLPNGNVVTTPGNYYSYFPLPSGKDSIIRTILTQKNKTTSSFQTTFCNGKSYSLPSGKLVAAAATYSDTIPNAAGCDSIITITLSGIPNSSVTKVVNICDGDSYQLPKGNFTSAQGTYKDTIPNSLGCDSLLTTYVYVHPVYSISKQDSIYKGDSYILPNGSTTGAQGVYVNNLLTATYNCDSVITVHLKVIDTSTTTGIRNHLNDIGVKFILNNNQLSIVNQTNSVITELAIYNSIGTLISIFSNPENTIFLPTLPKDVYILRAITNNKEQRVGKVVIY